MVLLQHRDNSVLSAALLCGLSGETPPRLSAVFRLFSLSDVARQLPRHRPRRRRGVRSFALRSAVNATRTSSLSSRVFISHNKRHTRKCRCQSLRDVSTSDDEHLAASAAAAFAAAASAAAAFAAAAAPAAAGAASACSISLPLLLMRA